MNQVIKIDFPPRPEIQVQERMDQIDRVFDAVQAFLLCLGLGACIWILGVLTALWVLGRLP